MVVLVIVLIVTNLVTLGVVAYFLFRPAEAPGVDPAAATALDRSPRPPAPLGGTRRLISIEILNPIELAGTRGRIAGIAGSLAPGLTRRIVYDQTLKSLKHELAGQKVVADVRIHTLRPVPPVEAQPPREPLVRYTDEVERIDLNQVDAASDEPTQ